jgi:transposase
MTGQTKKPKQLYPRQFKIKVATEVVSGIKGPSEASRDYNTHIANINHWVRVYGSEILKKQTQESVFSPSMKKSKTSDSKPDLEKQVQSLEEENLILRKKLVESTLQKEALTTLIDLAEENYGIELRKNSGAKQSSD